MEIMWLAFCLSLSLGAPANEPAALVVMGPASAVQESELRRVWARLAQQENLLSLGQLYWRLSGTSEYSQFSLEQAGDLLKEAESLEANFQSQRAAQLRLDGMAKFAQVLRPSQELRELAPHFWLGQAAALLAAEKPIEAFELALKASAIFPGLAIDLSRYTPALARLFANARQAQAKEGHLQLEVRAADVVEVHASLGTLGEPGKAFRLQLPHATGRLWFKAGEFVSLPHPLPPFGAEYVIDVDMNLEKRIFLKPWVGFVCAQACAEDAARLRQRLRIERLLLWDPQASSMQVQHLDVSAEPRLEVLEWIKVAEEKEVLEKEFSAALLAPLGFSQFYQKRVLAGSFFALVESAFLGWHIWAWRAHADALSGDDLAVEQARRRDRNTSAAFLYTSIVLGVAEALWNHHQD